MSQLAEKTWTYWIPSEDKFGGYAWVVLDSVGRFSTISDYGNYGYWWSSTGEKDFRVFVRDSLCKDPSYLVGKLGMGHTKKFRRDETLKALRKRIKECIPKHKQKDELALLEDIDHEGGFGLHAWYNRTALEDVGEDLVYDYSYQLYAFVEKVMPRLKDVLTRELAAEIAAKLTVTA